MIHTIRIYVNKNIKPFISAITLLNRIQDSFLYSAIEELSVGKIHKTNSLSVNFNDVLSEFKKHIDHKHPFSLYLFEYGLHDQIVFTEGHEGIVRLEGLSGKTYSFTIAYYIYKASLILSLNPSCKENNCLLSVCSEDIINEAICTECAQRLNDLEKDQINETLIWFKKLFSKIRNGELNERELNNIFKIPRQLIKDFTLDCQNKVCFIANDFSDNEIKIAVVQIKVSFDDDLKREFPDGGLYKSWSNNGLNQTNKIFNILKVLSENAAPDIVIFPELSVPPIFVTQYKKKLFHNEKKAPIIIAGSHYIFDEQKGSNYEGTPIIFPCGGSIINYSHYPSKYEAHSNPRYTYIARNPLWVIKSKFNDIGVLICKDLFHTKEIFSSDILDKIALLVCVMSDANVDEHYRSATQLSRERFVVLANTVGKYGAGNSAFMGPVKREHLVSPWKEDSHKRIYGFSEEDKVKEAILIASINLRYPYGDKNPTDTSRLHYNNFFDPKTIYLNEDGTERKAIHAN